MARYTGPAIRLHRRAGVNLSLRGRRASDEKYDRRLNQVPGMHPQSRRKLSNYGMQLREKQKLKWIYGLLEKQFRIFFYRAVRTRGITGENLIQLLERRLDNVVYRLLFSATRRESRQMVNHGLIFVNGKVLDIPSYIVEIGDVITVRNKEATVKRVKASLERWKDLSVVEWLELNPSTLEGKVLRLPVKADVTLPVEESQIVELYSK